MAVCDEHIICDTLHAWLNLTLSVLDYDASIRCKLVLTIQDFRLVINIHEIVLIKSQ
jgi:hypothetical protein